MSLRDQREDGLDRHGRFSWLMVGHMPICTLRELLVPEIVPPVLTGFLKGFQCK